MIVERARLGRTPLQVSRIGFGCCPLGGHGWGRVSEAELKAAVRRALDLGVRLFDTADVYGFGRSETLLSQALGEARHDVVITTKFGVRWSTSGRITRDCSPRYVRQALEASLRRLRVDRVPLYQIHWPDANTPLEETLEALCQLRDEGKIGAIGLSNFSSESLRRARELCAIDSLQVQYSLAHREPEAHVLDTAHRSGLAVLTWGSLAQGLFSGKYDAGSRFDRDDRRHRYDNFRGRKLRHNLRIVERLRLVGSLYGKTPCQVALRWLLDDPRVTVALTGIKNAAQIEQNHGALGWRLEPGHRAWIADATESAPAPHFAPGRS